MLDQEEVAQRIVAARHIRGLRQAEADELFHEASGGDFKKGEIGRMERREISVGPSRRALLAQVLNVPEEWFTADADDLFTTSETSSTTGSLAQINNRLTDIEEAIEKLVKWSRQGPTRKQLVSRLDGLNDLTLGVVADLKLLRAQQRSTLLPGSEPGSSS